MSQATSGAVFADLLLLEGLGKSSSLTAGVSSILFTSARTPEAIFFRRIKLPPRQLDGSGAQTAWGF